MPFDGAFTHKIAAELELAVDCHIDKIYQPSRDELVFLLRKKGFASRMILSARTGASRVHFTETKYENPDTPPMFCMLARKHFSAARLVSVKQPGFERIIEFYFETTNEMGDRVTPRVICELIGNQSNIILIDNEGRIIDAVRRSDIETAQRIIQPGAVYEYPQSQGKLNPLESSVDELINAVFSCSEIPLSRALLSVVDGFSPLIAREITYSAYNDDPIVSQIENKDLLYSHLKNVTDDIKTAIKPVLLFCDDNPSDYSYTNITQYGAASRCVCYESFSKLLDAYYSGRELKARIQRAASDVLKVVTNAHSRALKRMALRKKELNDCADREQMRIYGELIKANLYAIKNGSSSITVQNYYDPELKMIEIPLNPAILPAANAAKYFKDYKKSYTAEQTLTRLISEDQEEIVYLETVLESLERCDTLADISDIRDELFECGYIKIKSGGVRRKNTANTAFREYICREGYRVLVGRNNKQNDYITTKLASKSDMWFHVKNIPGSHVVIFCDGKPLSDETILSAAQLAAFYSKASSSSQVPVDYTPVKFVKKPNGAKPGMVIYTTNQTVFVKPCENAFNTVEKGEN
ncbi:MAG: fibronectin/fibrinogen-binding protein [Ruminococcaceae bacterium]|nr:fibronectin/fibrinogen-binding protein [Oscillospiraceae bacterium]